MKSSTNETWCDISTTCQVIYTSQKPLPIKPVHVEHFITIDIDTISLDLSILYFKGSQVKIPKF